MIIEQHLIEGCKRNDRLSQKKLYVLLLPYLNAVAKRYLSEDANRQDVLQEAFMRIFKHINNYDDNKSLFKTYATRILINCCLKNNDQYRPNLRQELLTDERHQRMIDPNILAKMSHKELVDFLKRMPVKYFEVFNLYVIDEYNHKEIAELLKIDISLSRKRLSRAREWLSVEKNELKIKQMFF